MLWRVGVVFCLFLAFVACQDPVIYPCSIPNDCTNTDAGYSYCREGQCRQCDPELRHKDCQCPLNQYCIADRNNVGSGNYFTCFLILVDQLGVL